MKKEPTPGSVYVYYEENIPVFAVVVTEQQVKMRWSNFSGIVIWTNPKHVVCNHSVGQHDHDWAVCDSFKKVSKKKLLTLFSPCNDWLR